MARMPIGIAMIHHGFARGGGGATTIGRSAGAATDCPQFGQNCAPTGIGEPQVGQYAGAMRRIAPRNVPLTRRGNRRTLDGPPAPPLSLGPAAEGFCMFPKQARPEMNLARRCSRRTPMKIAVAVASLLLVAALPVFAD